MLARFGAWRGFKTIAWNRSLGAPLRTALLAAVATAAGAQPSSPDLSVYLTLATDSVSRGMSLTDGDSALQVGIDYQHPSGFIAGSWLSNADYEVERLLEKPRRVALNSYLGFGRDRSPWSWTVLLTRYTYPDVTFNYDYNTLSGSVSWRRKISYAVTYTNRLFSRNASALNHELTGLVPLKWDVALSATAGRFDSTGRGGNEYAHWNVGVSKAVRRFSVDVRFYDTDTDVYSLLGEPVDRRWVLTLSSVFKPTSNAH